MARSATPEQRLGIDLAKDPPILDLGIHTANFKALNKTSTCAI
jgi:hypothetical protein